MSIQVSQCSTLSVSSMVSTRSDVMEVPHECKQDLAFQEVLLWPFPPKITLLSFSYSANESPQPVAINSLLSMMVFKPIITQATALANRL